VKFDSLRSDIAKDFAKLNSPKITNLQDATAGLPVEHSADKIRIQPPSSNDATAISDVLESHFSEMKEALKGFAADCDEPVKRWCDETTPSVDSATVAELLHRLENHILPNIVRNETLLGKCAPFPAILIASALFRLQLLAREDSGNAAREIAIIERLTAKALEVTYVHRGYKALFPGDLEV